MGQAGQSAAAGLQLMKGPLESYQLSKQKRQNGILPAGTLLAVSPVSPVMAPAGKAQSASRQLLDSVFDTIVRIFGEYFGFLVFFSIVLQFETKSSIVFRKSCYRR